MTPRPRLQLFAVGLLLAVVAGCNGNGNHHAGPSTASSRAMATDGQQVYLASNPTGAVLIRFTVTDGYLTGTVDASQLTSDVAGGQAPISGRVTGNAVSFDVRGKTWTGTLAGSALTVHIPGDDGSLTTLTFTPSTIDAYNAAVAALHGQGQVNVQATADARNAANAAAAVNQADRRVGSDLASLSAALQSMTADAVFTDDLESAANDLDGARQDYKTVQQDVSSHDCDVAGSDAGVVDSNAGTLDSDAGVIDSDVGVVEGDVDQVQDALSSLSKDLDTLQAALAGSPGTPTAHASAEVAGAIHKANRPIEAAHAAEASARAKVADLAAKAHDLARRAQRLAEGCS